jgi:hypothetical protein
MLLLTKIHRIQYNYVYTIQRYESLNWCVCIKEFSGCHCDEDSIYLFRMCCYIIWYTHIKYSAKPGWMTWWQWPHVTLEVQFIPIRLNCSTFQETGMFRIHFTAETGRRHKRWYDVVIEHRLVLSTLLTHRSYLRLKSASLKDLWLLSVV